jgi:hypothetical protein
MMDDTFTFIAPAMPRRTIDPFALRLAAAAAVFVFLVGVFGAFVVQQERAADARRAVVERQVLAQAEARAEALPDPRTQPEVMALLDSQARSSATRALELATSVALDTGGLAAAGPGQLTQAQPSMLFVDGMSTSPSVVSVEATPDRWSAAVMAPSGLCYWISLDPDGVASYGTGRACTGAAAAAAHGTAW